VPKFELRFCPGHWGRPFCLKLCDPSIYIIWTWFAPKKVTFQDFRSDDHLLSFWFDSRLFPSFRSDALQRHI
jgi:hypothetical protein